MLLTRNIFPPALPALRFNTLSPSALPLLRPAYFIALRALSELAAAAGVAATATLLIYSSKFV